MALPLPMLSVLLSTLFACSLAFRDCKKTRITVSDQRCTHGTAKRGIHGGWGEVVGRGCVCWCVCEGKRKSEGQKVRVRACVLKLNIAKKKKYIKKKKYNLKRSLKSTDKQTSSTNSSNTDVQDKKKKQKTKLQRPNQDCTRHISTQMRSRTITHRVMTQSWNPFRWSFPLSEAQSGPRVDPWFQLHLTNS